VILENIRWGEGPHQLEAGLLSPKAITDGRDLPVFWAHVPRVREPKLEVGCMLDPRMNAIYIRLFSGAITCHRPQR
jgi:hypothetical protein